jgi:hypothetical protein
VAGDRTAIVVVAGVGDERCGWAAERIADGLAQHQGWRIREVAAERYQVAGRFGALPNPAGQEMARISLDST